MACDILDPSASRALCNGWILTGIGTDAEHLKHAKWVTTYEYAGHARTGIFSASANCVHILSNMGQRIIMLQRDMKAAEALNSDWSQDLIKLSLCIPIVLSEMYV